MKPPIPLHGFNGRLQAHIKQLGRVHAAGIWPPQREESVPNGSLLRELLDSGEITLRDVQAVIAEQRKNPSRFSWLADVDDRILDKADDAFWARFGHNPTKAEWDVQYRKICRNLEKDWHFYDADLRQLRSETRTESTRSAAPARAPQPDQPPVMLEVPFRRREHGWGWQVVGGLALLAFGGLLGIAAAMEGSPKEIALSAIIWGLMVLGGIGMILTPFFKVSDKVYKCSRCNHQLESEEWLVRRCKNCGAEFPST